MFRGVNMYRYHVGDIVNGWEIVSRSEGVGVTAKCPFCGYEFYASKIGHLLKRKPPSLPCHHTVSDRPVKERLRSIFSGMKDRCYNPKNNSYKYYGGKGIEICSEWLVDKESFFSWALSHGYEVGLTIDRIDPNKNYCPENCRWLSMQENSKRAGDPAFYTVGDICDTGSGWSARLGIGINHITSFAKDHSKQEVESYISALLDGTIEKPSEFPLRLFTVNGISDTSAGWGERLGLHPRYLHSYNSYNGHKATEKRIEEILKGRKPKKNFSTLVTVYGVQLSVSEWSVLAGKNSVAFSGLRKTYGIQYALDWLKKQIHLLSEEKKREFCFDFNDDSVFISGEGKYRDVELFGVVLKEFEWEEVFHLEPTFLAKYRRHHGQKKSFAYMESLFLQLSKEEKLAAKQRQGTFSFMDLWAKGNRPRPKQRRNKKNVNSSTHYEQLTLDFS